MNNIRQILVKLVNVGIQPEEESLIKIKSIVILNRLLLISTLTLTMYTLIMLLLGMYLHAIMCFIAIPIYVFIYFLMLKHKVSIAKLIFSGFTLFLAVIFSIIFGKGLGSEYWIIVISGMALLIFTEKESTLKFVFISILTFVFIEWMQHLIEPIVVIDEQIKNITFVTNLTFIFTTSFIISVVLRYGTEDFEQRIQLRHRMLTKKNKDLTDSINYARRIQSAVLPPENLKKSLSKNLLVIFKPKEIVSGDFYWMHKFPDRLLFAVVDGVGHGVSGALVSIMAHTLLNQCVEEYELREPKDIIAKMTNLILERKKQWNDDLADHLEITLCCYEWKTSRMSYISNGNALYLIKHVNNISPEDSMEINEDDRYILKEIRNTHSFQKIPISASRFHEGNHHFQKDDMLYVATNGISSQLGGPKVKKLTSKRLKDLLMSVQHLSLHKQGLIIEDILKNWQGRIERTDDITLIGFKI